MEDIKQEKNILVFWVIIFIFGIFLSLFMSINFANYTNWILKESFIFCLFFIFFEFIATTILTMLFSKTKGAFYLIFLFVLLRGFCFGLTLKALFCSYSILAAILIVLTLLLKEIMIFVEICQMLIYYYRHNTSKYLCFCNFEVYLMIFCVICSLLFLFVLFFILHPLLLFV